MTFYYLYLIDHAAYLYFGDWRHFVGFGPSGVDFLEGKNFIPPCNWHCLAGFGNVDWWDVDRLYISSRFVLRHRLTLPQSQQPSCSSKYSNKRWGAVLWEPLRLPFNKDLTQCVQACGIPNNKVCLYIVHGVIANSSILVNIPAIESGMNGLPAYQRCYGANNSTHFATFFQFPLLTLISAWNSDE